MPLSPPPPTIVEQIHRKMRENPKRMTPYLAKELNIREVDVIRHLPDGASVELDIAEWEAIIRGFESLGKVHVVCNNGVVVLESYGTFGNFSTWGEFFNVQTNIDMHIRFRELATVFAVEKASHTDGVKTCSVQFFTTTGDSAFKVFCGFGGKEPPVEQRQAFEALRDAYRLNR